LASRQSSVHSSHPDLDFPVAIGSESDLLAYYGKSTFAAYLNTSFQIFLGASSVGKMSLEEIAELVPPLRRKAAQLEGKECFALRFRGSRNASLRHL
jgi:hypothetical protein